MQANTLQLFSLGFLMHSLCDLCEYVNKDGSKYLRSRLGCLSEQEHHLYRYWELIMTTHPPELKQGQKCPLLPLYMQMPYANTSSLDLLRIIRWQFSFFSPRVSLFLALFSLGGKVCQLTPLSISSRRKLTQIETNNNQQI